MFYWRSFVIIMGLLLCTLFSNAQNDFGIYGYYDTSFHPGMQSQVNMYNGFVGDDAGKLQTTILGFGSGFIFDIFSFRQYRDIVALGTRDVNLSLGLGFAIAKYRFAKNLWFEKPANEVMANVDDDPDHNYDNSFFGYTKSKIVIGSGFAPLNFNFRIGSMYFTFGGLADLYISGKHKVKYRSEEEGKKKRKVGNEDFRDYNLNKVKYGGNVVISHKSGWGISGYYMHTPTLQGWTRTIG